MQVLRLYIGVIKRCIIFMNRPNCPVDSWLHVGQDNLQVPPQQYSPCPAPQKRQMNVVTVSEPFSEGQAFRRKLKQSVDEPDVFYVKESGESDC